MKLSAVSVTNFLSLTCLKPQDLQSPWPYCFAIASFFSLSLSKLFVALLCFSALTFLILGWDIGMKSESPLFSSNSPIIPIRKEWGSGTPCSCFERTKKVETFIPMAKVHHTWLNGKWWLKTVLWSHICATTTHRNNDTAMHRYISGRKITPLSKILYLGKREPKRKYLRNT